jgi:hypothetical protein
MNYTESFDQFAARVTTLDLALYAGIGLILWVLLKDRMSPVQKIISDLITKVKSSSPSTVTGPTNIVKVVSETQKQDLFYKLISSWKQTRDLAVQSECSEAVKVIDQMFPFLSPNACSKQERSDNKNQ